MEEMEHRISRGFTERPASGGRILYWMQASVRVRDNLALALALDEARERRLPLDVLFCLDARYPEANERSFAFLLDGLADASRGLEALGLSLTVALSAADRAVAAAGERAAAVFFDEGYLPFARSQRADIAARLPCPVITVADNVSMPPSLVSAKEEWSAATLRAKLMRLVSLEGSLPQSRPLEPPLRGAPRPGESIAESLFAAGIRVLERRPGRDTLESLGVDSSVAATGEIGGEAAAWDRWEEFRDERLASYDSARNDPNIAGCSGLSPALHFGHISPLSIVRDLKARGLWRAPASFRAAGADPASKFLDELLVRRELSINFVLHNRRIDSWDCLPPWARATLERHRADGRSASYSLEEFESAATHERAWNAAQRELVATGRMHGHMRMYWGKKILEWSADPGEAYRIALLLNNKYALDGRDPNSYAGVAWCFGKHDRPWGERAVYGTVRSMVESGLRRKFDLDAYVRRWGA